MLTGRYGASSRRLDSVKTSRVPPRKANHRGWVVSMPSSEELTQRAGSLRFMTGFTPAVFMALLPLFDHARVAYLQDRTIDGRPRTSRRSSMYDTYP
jgi:hypothetical protein